jgi:hypothetical protein
LGDLTWEPLTHCDELGLPNVTWSGCSRKLK